METSAPGGEGDTGRAPRYDASGRWTDSCAGALSLAPVVAEGHSPPAVKLTSFLLLSAAAGLAMCSCETVDDRKAGGGAFEDSYLGKRLDSNNPSLEDNSNEKGKTAAPSYQQWRHD